MTKLNVYFTRSKRGGTKKTCKECGHEWWIGKYSQSPDTCYECLIYDAMEEAYKARCEADNYGDYCHNCGRCCDGCCGDSDCEGCNKCG